MSEKRERLSATTLAEVESALKEYCSVVLATDLSQWSQNVYIDNATNFVRWMRGDFNPGARKNPYALKRKPDAVA